MLSGKFRHAKGQAYAGTFAMYIAENGDLKQYATKEKFVNEDKSSFVVDMVWDVDVRLEDDAKINAALFKRLPNGRG